MSSTDSSSTTPVPFAEPLRRLFRRLHSSPDNIAVALAIITGIVAGVSAYVFEKMLHFAQHHTFGLSVEQPLRRRFWIILFPTLGGLITGAITRWISRDARGQGVGEVIFAIRRNKSVISGKAVIGKALASTATIGTGGSGGPEGPIIQIGGGVGSMLGRALRLPPELLRIMVAAGAAGGISAVLNAPISGVLFAMEVILKDFVVNAFSLVVLASVSGAVVSHLLLGDQTFLKSPAFALGGNAELFLYAVLGFLSAGGSVIFVRIMRKVERFFERREGPHEIWMPALGGLGVGLIGWFLPQVMGTGIEFMTSVVRSESMFTHAAIAAFFALALAKMIATALSLGSGGSGGLLMPTFFCGTVLGAVFGLAGHIVFPGLSPYGSYALVGSVAFFAAVTRAPFTSIILLFEITHDEKVILPAMVACVIATLSAHNISPLSYEAMRLSKKGLSPEDLESRGLMAHLSAESIMISPVVTVTEKMTFPELREVIRTTRHTGYPVLNDMGLLTGLLSDSDLHEGVQRGGDPNVLTVSELMRKNIGTVTRDASLRRAIEVMNEFGQDRVPVVDNRNPQHLVGLVSRSQILKALSK